NPFVTNDIGYYGWDVAEGCWYVVVEAEGYDTLTSPVVGVPPEVTDLHLALTPQGNDACAKAEQELGEAKKASATASAAASSAATVLAAATSQAATAKAGLTKAKKKLKKAKQAAAAKK